MAPPLQAQISILVLLLAASMLLMADGSFLAPSGYTFDLTHAGRNEEVHHIKLRIDNKPRLFIADTGSDLIWLSHDMCSSEYIPIECGPKTCDHLMKNMKCCRGHCMFERSYGSGHARGFTRGFMVDKVAIGHTDKVDLTIGCAVDFGCPPDVNKRDCSLYKDGGIVGLGRGQMSLLSQLAKKSSSFKKKFSFCLPPKEKKASKIKFGDQADTAPAHAGSVEFKADDSKYYVNLKKISVGEEELKISVGEEELHDSIGDGRMLIDSGLTLTKLPRETFNKVAEQVKVLMREKTQNNKLEPKEKPVNVGYTCYDLQELPEGMPELTIEFDTPGEEKQIMSLPKDRYLRLDSSEVCLAIKHTTDSSSTLGNFQMQNMAMLFDLTKGKTGTLQFWREYCGDLM